MRYFMVHYHMYYPALNKLTCSPFVTADEHLLSKQDVENSLNAYLKKYGADASMLDVLLIQEITADEYSKTVIPEDL